MKSQARSLLRVTALATVGLLAVACGGEQQAANGTATGAATSASTPEAAVLNSVRLLRNNDFNSLVAASVPPAQLEAAKAKWTDEIRKEQITDEDRAEFAQTMNRLTAPDAEQQMLAELRPQLEQFQGEMKAQLPAMVAMGKGFAISAINENQDIPADQKPQVINLVNALGSWVETGAFADIGRAERAIGEITKTARSLPIKTLDDLHAQDFNGLMGLAGTVAAGAKRTLAHYDINIDSALDSVRAETLSQDGDNAKVRIHATLFNTPLTFDTDLVRVDGNWYGKKTVEELSTPSAATAE